MILREFFSKLPFKRKKSAPVGANQDANIEDSINTMLSCAHHTDDALDSDLNSELDMVQDKPQTPAKKRFSFKSPYSLKALKISSQTAQKVRKAKNQLLQKNHFGLLLEQNKLFTAHLTFTPQHVSIDLLATLPCDSDAKPLDILKEEISAKKIKKAVITTGFSSLKTLARQIDIEFFKPLELDALIKYQVEPLLPYDISQAVIDKIKLPKRKTHEFLVFAARKEDLQLHLAQYLDQDIDPEIIAPKSLGLAHFARLFFPDSAPRLFIDISVQATTCLLLQNGTPLAVRSLPMGLEPHEEQKNTLGEEKETSHLEVFARELSRILLGFQSTFSDLKSVPIVFTGVAERDPLILSLLGKLLGYRTETITALPPQVTLAPACQLEDCVAFAIPIGLALISSPVTSQNGIQEELYANFRKDEFTYSRKWRRWKKDLIVYFSLMVMVSCCLYFLSTSSMKKEEHTVREQYSDLVALLEKTPEEIEAAFAKKMHMPQLRHFLLKTYKSVSISLKTLF